MNGDSFLLLLDELTFGPWTNRLFDWLFYVGVSIGIAKIVKISWKLVSGAYIYYYPRNVSSSLTKKFGRWAVVTGATSSLGEAFAMELASHGFDVVLVSRSYDNLLTLVSDIQSRYSVQAYGIHADFFAGQQVFKEIEEALLTDKLDIGILVNLNPIKYDHPQYFTQVPTMRLWQIVNVNIAATVMMTHIILPSMLERGRGAVINVSSAFGCFPPTPLLSVEVASMAFINKFGQSLHEECHKKGIIVQTLTPLSLSKSDNEYTVLSPSPRMYVRNALSTLNYSSVCCGYVPHALLSFLYQLLPSSWWMWLSSHSNRAARNNSLTTGLSQHDVLFARKPRQVVTDVARSRSESPADKQMMNLSHFEKTASPVPLSSPLIARRTLSVDSFHRPKYQRNYSRVVVVPSLVHESNIEHDN